MECKIVPPDGQIGREAGKNTGHMCFQRRFFLAGSWQVPRVWKRPKGQLQT